MAGQRELKQNAKNTKRKMYLIVDAVGQAGEKKTVNTIEKGRKIENLDKDTRQKIIRLQRRNLPAWNLFCPI
jgi:hypothetical protein